MDKTRQTLIPKITRSKSMNDAWHPECENCERICKVLNKSGLQIYSVGTEVSKSAHMDEETDILAMQNIPADGKLTELSKGKKVPKSMLGIKRSMSMNDALLSKWEISTAIEWRGSVNKDRESQIKKSIVVPAVQKNDEKLNTSKLLQEKRETDQQNVLVLSTLQSMNEKLNKMSKEIREIRCTLKGNASNKSKCTANGKKHLTSIRMLRKTMQISRGKGQRKATGISKGKSQRKARQVSRETHAKCRISFEDLHKAFSQIHENSKCLWHKICSEMAHDNAMVRKSKLNIDIMDLKAIIKDVSLNTSPKTKHEKLPTKGTNNGTLLDSFLYRNYHNGLSNGQTNLQFHPLVPSNFEEYVEKELCSLQSSQQREVESAPHSMNLELIRLETFKNFPLSNSVSTIKLAKEGFYYSGEGDRVVCFACGSERSGWRDGDIPREIHLQISPQCNLLGAGNSNNVPIGGVPNGLSSNQQPASIGQSSSVPNTASQNSVNSNVPSPASVQTNGTHENGCESSGQLENRHNSDNTPETSNRDHVAVVPNRDVRNGDNGPSDLNSNSEPLPRSGICNHNTAEQTSKANANTLLKRSRDIQEKINAYLRGLDPLGINFDRPKYHAYAVLATRISSFKDWPTSLTQTPRDLATAGFLYAGYGDYTRCFFCGGGLRNWEPGDDPWTEHARWFPKCAYLRQNKGDEFVALVQIEHQEQEALEAEEMAAGSVHQENVCNGGSQLDISTLSSFQSVLEMGYPTDVVRDAFNQLKANKDPYEITGQDLMEFILSNEDRNNGLDIPPPVHNARPQSNVDDGNRTNSQQTPQRNQSTPEPQVPSQGASGTSDSKDVSRNEEKLDSLSGILPSMSLEDTASLIEENRRLKDLRLCKICLENEASIAMLPCGHLCCCADCAPAMRKCPICRQFVKGTVRTWLV